MKKDRIKKPKKRIKWGVTIPYCKYKAKHRIVDIASSFNMFFKETGIYYDDNYKIGIHNQEIEIAKWLCNKFGGFINCLTEEDDKPNYDYNWNEEAWELKTLRNASLNTIHGRVCDAVKQISYSKNPVGIILDLTNNQNNLKNIKGAINRALDSPNREIDVIVMIKIDNEAVSILKHEKNT